MACAPPSSSILWDFVSRCSSVLLRNLQHVFCKLFCCSIFVHEHRLTKVTWHRHYLGDRAHSNVYKLALEVILILCLVAILVPNDGFLRLIFVGDVTGRIHSLFYINENGWISIIRLSDVIWNKGHIFLRLGQIWVSFNWCKHLSERGTSFCIWQRAGCNCKGVKTVELGDVGQILGSCPPHQILPTVDIAWTAGNNLRLVTCFLLSYEQRVQAPSIIEEVQWLTPLLL